jgi:hypothetical protein
MLGFLNDRKPSLFTNLRSKTRYLKTSFKIKVMWGYLINWTFLSPSWLLKKF